MKDLLQKLDKAFESKIRLALMSVLVANEKEDFNTLKGLLDVTDGNLASHAKALEKAEYIIIEKKFIGKKPNTTYKITPLGRKAFEDHLNALEEILKQNK